VLKSLRFRDFTHTFTNGSIAIGRLHPEAAENFVNAISAAVGENPASLAAVEVLLFVPYSICNPITCIQLSFCLTNDTGTHEYQLVSDEKANRTIKDQNGNVLDEKAAQVPLKLLQQHVKIIRCPKPFVQRVVVEMHDQKSRTPAPQPTGLHASLSSHRLFKLAFGLIGLYLVKRFGWRRCSAIAGLASALSFIWFRMRRSDQGVYVAFLYFRF
jgi:hypothetical protein